MIDREDCRPPSGDSGIEDMSCVFWLVVIVTLPIIIMTLLGLGR